MGCPWRDIDRKRVLSYRTGQLSAVTVREADRLTPFFRLRHVTHALDLPGTPTIFGCWLFECRQLRDYVLTSAE